MTDYKDAPPSQNSNSAPPSPPINTPAKRGLIGLALGAGAARGWAHFGVIERLMEAGINPDVIAGTSVGAMVGGCHAAGRLAELKEFALGLTRRRMFSFLDFSWAGSGILSGDKLQEHLGQHLGDITFETTNLPFICIATELMTGHEIWLRRGPLATAIRASYALPGIFRPVQRGNMWLIDGAVVNPIPVSACRAMGARLVIAVNLNSDAFGGTIVQTPPRNSDEAKLSPTKKTPPSDTPSPSILRQLVGRHDDPGLSTVLISAFNITQDRLARSRLAGDPPDVSIVPRTEGVGLFDFEKAAEAIASGREATEKALPEIEYALNVLERLSN